MLIKGIIISLHGLYRGIQVQEKSTERHEVCAYVCLSLSICHSGPNPMNAKKQNTKEECELGKERSFTHHPLFSSFATPLIFYLENEREYSGICLLTKSTCGLPWPTAVSHCRILICSTHTFHEFHKSLPLIFYSNCQLQPLFCFPSTVVRNIEFYLKIMK